MTGSRFAAAILLLVLPLMSHAQLSGHNTRGDYGLVSGTQAPVLAILSEY